MKSVYLSYIPRLRERGGLKGKRKTHFNICIFEDLFCGTNYFLKHVCGMHIFSG